MRSGIISLACLALASLVGCTNQNASEPPQTIQVFDEVILGGESVSAVMTQSGEGTKNDPLGIDIEFVPRNSSR